MNANPYTPGAGFMPAYLAGRDSLIENAEEYLASIQGRYPQRSVIYYGLRGVGKTVLLNRIEQAADNLGILYAHIEATETPKGKRGEPGGSKFTNKFVREVNKMLLDISTKEKAKDLVKKCASLLRAFSLSYNAIDNSVSLTPNQDITIPVANYTDDLTDIIVQLGKTALQTEDTICFFIDEVQYLSEEELGGVIAAIHRCNQLRLPVMAFCAGLPKVLKIAGEAYSYAERLFKYEYVDALSPEEARDAICEPAKQYNIEYSDKSVDKIIALTGCYPHFIQQLCSVIWKKSDEKGTIEVEDVLNCEKDFFKELDVGFFEVRYDRCTKREKQFMVAMVKCGELPCTMANVARILDAQASSISPIRGQLIAKGMIYPPERGEVNFTVPQFDNYIKRINPNLEL